MIKKHDPISLANSLMESRSNPHHINPMSERFQKLLSEIIEYLLSSEKWYPVEIAPKNTAVILYDGLHLGEACLIEYVDGPSGWYWASDRDPIEGKPSHWMPLPKAPKPNTG